MKIIHYLPQVHNKVYVLTYTFINTHMHIYNAWKNRYISEKVRKRFSEKVFSCKFVAYFQNTFSYEHLWWTASVHMHIFLCKHEKLVRCIIIHIGNNKIKNSLTSYFGQYHQIIQSKNKKLKQEFSVYTDHTKQE